MGYLGDAAARVRDWFRRDKEQVPTQFAKGGTAGTLPTTGMDLMQAYGYDVTSDFLRLEQDLLSRFIDYEEMDEYPLIATALNIMADDASQPDHAKKRALWVSSSDKTIEEVGDDLFHRTLRIDEEIWEIARTLCQMGNDYEEILVDEQGVRGLNFLPAPTVRRIEGPRGQLYGFVQDYRARFNYSAAEFQQILAQRLSTMQGQISRGTLSGAERLVALEDWEVVHFRLRGAHRRSVYGRAILEPARWIWKRLVLLEDAAMMYRLQRAPERYAFYVDVGNLPPQEAMAYLNRVKQNHKKKRFIDPATGKLSMKFDPVENDNDFIIPVKDGTQGTRIEVLGSPSWQAVEDVTYFKEQLLGAISVPSAYLSQSGAYQGQNLSTVDVRFARTILRIQRELKDGFSKVFRIHLAALGIDPTAIEYAMHMTVPSSIFELAQIEVQNARADLAARMQAFVSQYYILSNIFGLSDEVIQTVMDQRSEDMEREANIQATSQSIIQRAIGQAATQGQVAGQIDAQQMMAQAGMLAPVGQPGQPTTQPLQQSLSPIGGPLIRIAGPRNVEYYSQERRLFEGANKEMEKGLHEKIDRVLHQDQALGHRLVELNRMLRELTHTVQKPKESFRR